MSNEQEQALEAAAEAAANGQGDPQDLFTSDGQLGLLPDAGPTISSALRRKFIHPPFSILDRRQGYWQERRRGWLGLGIQSELGRDDELLFSKNLSDYEGLGTMKQTSIFDPVLCELAYSWFSPPGGHVIDPFAGGSVRGVVAGALGRRYVGIDLREEQVVANREQADAIFDRGPDFGRETHKPGWVVGDATTTRSHVPADYRADFMFTCPPYGDLEVYSSDPRDLSTMSYSQFREALGRAIGEGLSLLRPDRFAGFVVSDIRDPQGNYRGFVADTIAAFESYGAPLYNQAIIIDPVGTGAVRATRQFNARRKLVSMHQHLLVFTKGDAKRATEAVGEIPLND